MDENGLGGVLQIILEYIADTGNFGVILYIIEIFVGLLLPAIRNART